MRSFGYLAAATIFSAIIALSTFALAGDVTGGGATFPYPIYAKWIDAYRAETGIAIKYEPVGSGLGIKLVMGNSVTFGASDMPLKPQDLAQAGLIQFPTVAGGNVPIVNLTGVTPGQMTLNGPTLAAIYLGKITKWSDPAIAKLNPTLSLPALPITVVHRSDGSGTTFIWADYLSTQSAAWRNEVGANTSVNRPVGVGANGNEGVAAATAQTTGAIGYVEYAYAVQKGLSYTKMVNRSGRAVAPSIDSFKAAMSSANWEASNGTTGVLTNQAGDDVWPIAGATFILMPRKPTDAAASAAALKFFRWAYAKGGDMALALNYVPMPMATVQQIEASWTKISGAGS